MITEKHRAFKDALEAIAEMTVEQLAVDVATLEDDVRAALARGPLERRWSCGVCAAFGETWWSNVEPDPTFAHWRVWAYHEVPKLRMTHGDHRFYGAHANETYVRCLATYRAAGWDGEAPEPNA